MDDVGQTREWLEARRMEAHVVKVHWGAEGPPRTRQHDKGRKARYFVLEKLARRLKATHVLVAHHADDQAESVLLAAAHLSGVFGLAGMPPRRILSEGVALLRPLLPVGKARLEHTCRHWQQPYAHDPGNTRTDDGAQRARVRQALAIAGIDPHALLSAQRVFASIREDVEGQVDAFQDAHVRLDRGYGVVRFPWAALCALPGEVAVRVLVRLVAYVGAREGPPRLTSVRRVLASLRDGKARSAGGAVFVVSRAHGADEQLVYASADYAKSAALDFTIDDAMRYGNWRLTPRTKFFRNVSIRPLTQHEFATLWRALSQADRARHLAHAPLACLQQLPGVVTAQANFECIGFVPQLFDSGNSFTAHFEPVQHGTVIQSL